MPLPILIEVYMCVTWQSGDDAVYDTETIDLGTRAGINPPCLTHALSNKEFHNPPLPDPFPLHPNHLKAPPSSSCLDDILVNEWKTMSIAGQGVEESGRADVRESRCGRM